METMRARLVRSVAIAFCAFGAAAAVAAIGASARQAETSPGSPEDNVTASRECRYTLAARVRPLLFWIGKSDVGEGRISWLAGENGRQGYELLIGSLPERAPRGINRWGYISEVRQGGGVRTFGFMTEVDEETYEQAEKTTGVPPGSRVYKVVRATVGGGEALAGVSGVPLPDTLTLRQADVVAARLSATAPLKSLAVPPGTQPGFLYALASLLHENVETCLQKGVPPARTSRSFVFANRLFEVTTTSSRLLTSTKVRDREFTNVIESQFEARQRGKSDGSRFRLIYGTEGSLREVPVRIVYRPKWWFEADALLIGLPGQRLHEDVTR